MRSLQFKIMSGLFSLLLTLIAQSSWADANSSVGNSYIGINMNEKYMQPPYRVLYTVDGVDQSFLANQDYAARPISKNDPIVQKLCQTMLQTIDAVGNYSFRAITVGGCVSRFQFSTAAARDSVSSIQYNLTSDPLNAMGDHLACGIGILKAHPYGAGTCKMILVGY